MTPSTPIQLWAARLDAADAGVERLYGLLDPRERARVERLRRDVDKRHYIVSHGILREILGGATETDPAAVEFSYGPFGKPYIGEAGPDRVEFNMSDSNGMLLVAVVRGVAVGVDIEMHRPMDFLKFARRFFTSAEVDALEALPNADLQTAFFRTWTCKEAYVKGWGYGIQRNVGKFEVSVGDAKSRLIRCGFDENSPNRWSLVDIDAIAGFSATVAVEMSGVDRLGVQWWAQYA